MKKKSKKLSESRGPGREKGGCIRQFARQDLLKKKKLHQIEKIVFHYKNNGFGPKIIENTLKT